MKTATIAGRRELAGRLRPLLEDFRFTWGRPAHRTDGVVAVSIDRVAGEDGSPELLVTLFDGLPPSAAVHGLPWTVRRAGTEAIIRVGCTDCGQFRLAGLGPGEYRLEVETLVPGVQREPTAAASARWEDAAAGQIAEVFGAADFAEAPSKQEFTSDDPDQAVWARIAQTRHGVLRLESKVRLDSELWGGHRLARFRVWNEQAELLAQGYLGLYPVDGGRAFGELDLDGFAPDLRKWVPKRCYLRIDPQDPARLEAQDRDDLERSLACTQDRRCQAVLEEGLAALPLGGPVSPGRGE